MGNQLQENNSEFPVGLDLKNVEGKKDYRHQLQISQFKPYFDPKKYVQENKPLGLIANRLSHDQLKYYAELAQKIRSKFMTKAKETDDALAEAYEECKH